MGNMKEKLMPYMIALTAACALGGCQDSDQADKVPVAVDKQKTEVVCPTGSRLPFCLKVDKPLSQE